MSSHIEFSGRGYGTAVVSAVVTAASRKEIALYDPEQIEGRSRSL